MGRRSDRKQADKELAERAQDLKQKAKVVADEGGEAVRDFASTTGAAAKDFAQTAFQAAKELVDVVERAGERLEKESKPARKRGRKLFKATIAVGAGVALLANESARNFLASKLGFGAREPEPWESPAPSGGNGDYATPPVSSTTS
jgi:hypothetical protein